MVVHLCRRWRCRCHLASNVETRGRLQPHRMNPPKPKTMGWCWVQRDLRGACLFLEGSILSIPYMLYHGVLKDLLQDDDIVDDEDKGRRSRKSSCLQNTYIKLHCTLFLQQVDKKELNTSRKRKEKRLGTGLMMMLLHPIKMLIGWWLINNLQIDWQRHSSKVPSKTCFI